MDIGRTNKRITFCRYEEKENALSQIEQTLIKVKTVWASVEPTRGREYQEAQRVRPELTYKVTTRYHKEIAPDMLIKWGKRCFNIVSVINVRERNEMLEIICIEKIAKDSKKGGVMQDGGRWRWSIWGFLRSEAFFAPGTRGCFWKLLRQGQRMLGIYFMLLRTGESGLSVCSLSYFLFSLP